MTDTSLAGGLGPAGHRCQRHQELTMGDSVLERLRRDTNQRALVARTLDGVTGLGCFVPGQDGLTWTSARNHQISGGTTWR